MTHLEYYQMRHTPGWIEVICGGMFSGKTEELIRRVKRAQIARQQVQVFKPQIDDRYVKEAVNSHSGGQLTAERVNSSAEILAQVGESTQVVAIDEVQFFDEAILDACQALAEAGKRVITTGLDMDFRGEPFALTARLLAMAERVEKLQAICMVCGAPATRTQRLIDGQPAHYDDAVILVGASEQYEARCRSCHEVTGKPGVPFKAGDRASLQRA